MIYIKSVYHDQISCFLRQFKTTIMIVRNFIFFSLYQYFSFFYFYFILLFINNRFIFFIIYLSLQILNSILRSMFLFKTNTLVLHNPFFSISCPNFILQKYEKTKLYISFSFSLKFPLLLILQCKFSSYMLHFIVNNSSPYVLYYEFFNLNSEALRTVHLILLYISSRC